MEEYAKEHYAGLDVSLKAVSICVSDGEGRVLWRGEVVNESDVVCAALSRHGPNLVRAVLETGSCGVHLYRGLEAAGVPIVCICARHAKARRDFENQIRALLRISGFKVGAVANTNLHKELPIVTALRGFRLGARRAVVSCTTSGAPMFHAPWRPEASQRRPRGSRGRPPHLYRRGTPPVPPRRVVFPVPSGCREGLTMR